MEDEVEDEQGRGNQENPQESSFLHSEWKCTDKGLQGPENRAAQREPGNKGELTLYRSEPFLDTVNNRTTRREACRFPKDQ